MLVVRWEIQLDMLCSEGPDSLAQIVGIYWKMCYTQQIGIRGVAIISDVLLAVSSISNSLGSQPPRGSIKMQDLIYSFGVPGPPAPMDFLGQFPSTGQLSSIIQQLLTEQLEGQHKLPLRNALSTLFCIPELIDTQRHSVRDWLGAV